MKISGNLQKAEFKAWPVFTPAFSLNVIKISRLREALSALFPVPASVGYTVIVSTAFLSDFFKKEFCAARRAFFRHGLIPCCKFAFGITAAPEENLAPF